MIVDLLLYLFPPAAVAVTTWLWLTERERRIDSEESVAAAVATERNAWADFCDDLNRQLEQAQAQPDTGTGDVFADADPTLDQPLPDIAAIVPWGDPPAPPADRGRSALPVTPAVWDTNNDRWKGAA